MKLCFLLFFVFVTFWRVFTTEIKFFFFCELQELNSHRVVFPWLNVSLTTEERVSSLISALNVDQKVQQLVKDTPAIPELKVIWLGNFCSRFYNLLFLLIHSPFVDFVSLKTIVFSRPVWSLTSECFFVPFVCFSFSLKTKCCCFATCLCKKKKRRL